MGSAGTSANDIADFLHIIARTSLRSSLQLRRTSPCSHLSLDHANNRLGPPNLGTRCPSPPPHAPPTLVLVHPDARGHAKEHPNSPNPHLAARTMERHGPRRHLRPMAARAAGTKRRSEDLVRGTLERASDAATVPGRHVPARGCVCEGGQPEEDPVECDCFAGWR